MSSDLSKNVRLLIRMICHISRTFIRTPNSHLLHVGTLVRLRSVLGDKDTKINHILRLHQQSLRSQLSTPHKWQFPSIAPRLEHQRHRGAIEKCRCKCTIHYMVNPTNRNTPYAIYHALRNMINMVVTTAAGRLLLCSLWHKTKFSQFLSSICQPVAQPLPCTLSTGMIHEIGTFRIPPYSSSKVLRLILQ